MTFSLFKIKSKLYRLKLRLSQNKRPTSYPYLSGDGFRQIADHIYDETQTFDPSLVKEREIIFVKTDLLDKYFQEIHPQIKSPYKLITHNSDRNIAESDLKYLDEDDKIIHWFAQNVLVSHPKLTPLPIGLENKHYYFNGIPKLFDKLRKKSVTKIPRILFGFSVSTNKKERQEALDNLVMTPTADKITSFPLPPQYLKLLNAYQFVASPPGNGLDCHRTWEAMYLKTIPIIKRSAMAESWQELGLPIWLIDEWSELINLTETDLSSRYQERIAQTSHQILFIDYWSKLIREID